MQNYSSAVSDFTSAIDIDPNFGTAFMYRALVYKNENDYANAVSDLNSALTVQPTLLDAYLFRGEIYTAMGSY